MNFLSLHKNYSFVGLWSFAYRLYPSLKNSSLHTINDILFNVWQMKYLTVSDYQVFSDFVFFNSWYLST